MHNLSDIVGQWTPGAVRREITSRTALWCTVHSVVHLWILMRSFLSACCLLRHGTYSHWLVAEHENSLKGKSYGKYAGGQRLRFGKSKCQGHCHCRAGVKKYHSVKLWSLLPVALFGAEAHKKALKSFATENPDEFLKFLNNLCLSRPLQCNSATHALCFQIHLHGTNRKGKGYVHLEMRWTQRKSFVVTKPWNNLDNLEHLRPSEDIMGKMDRRRPETS